jgi:hypothetical protein
MVSRSCKVCRSLKKKCDEQRPCSRCLSKGEPDKCVDWEPDFKSVRKVTLGNGKGLTRGFPGEAYDNGNPGFTETAVVERPLPFRGGGVTQISFSSECPLTAVMERMGWSHAILLRTWEFGFNADALINIFASVPQDLADVLKTGFASLDIIQNKKCAADRVQSANLAGGGEDFLPRAGGGSCYFDDMEDRLWDRRRDCGYLRLDFEPRSQRRRHAFLNTHFSNLIGLHKEETLARIANREMPLPMTEVSGPANPHDHWGTGCTSELMEQTPGRIGHSIVISSLAHRPRI